MREILFRGKTLTTGEWVYGFYVGASDNARYHEIFVPDDSALWGRYIVDPSTVGQYTGLTDKTGARIYEGDILQWNETEWGEPHIDIVSWDYELFNMRKSDWADFCEVIGNIHDNPEMIEG